MDKPLLADEVVCTVNNEPHARISLSSDKGLTSAEAAKRLEEYGRNEIPEEKESLCMMFLKQFAGAMPIMIIIAGILSAILQEVADFVIITILLLTNATLGFIEEKNAAASVAALKDGLTAKAPVKRDGKFVDLEVAEIVPGDVLFLKLGNVIPADCMYLHGDELNIDQAALTGESLPVLVPREDDKEGEPHNGKKMWSGSIIKVGECECVVTETGLNTMIGDAAKSIQESGGKQIGLFESKIIMAARFLIVITLAVVVVLFIFEMVVNKAKFDKVLEMSLSLVIASVPVALPMVMKVTMSIGAKEMADEGGIVTHLTALEEIASMRVLCSDKTGTLTTAEMTVYHDRAGIFSDVDREGLLEYAVLASNQRNLSDPIDGATFKAYAKLKGTTVEKSLADLNERYKIDKYAGFNPMVKRTVCNCTHKESGDTFQISKGIISKVLKTDEEDGGEKQWICEDHAEVSKKVNKMDEGFGKDGYKTIGVAMSKNGGPMRYIGTLPIMDPPRFDTKVTIDNIRDSKVAVKMITGDHLNIAKELARQIELGTGILHSSQLWPQSAQRDEMILHSDGFAQVMPKDKHEVVSVLQNAKLVVGMTGDGVNDAPALARAQIGIAVHGATDAARSAADIVLTRDGLSPIFTAISVSRRIFKRLKSYVIYRICITVQVVLFLVGITFIYSQDFKALFIILLALFHDLQIVTIAYDNQVASKTPETPTVEGLLIVSYALGILMCAETLLFWAFGHFFMSHEFLGEGAHGKHFNYKQTCAFLQISNSSAILIFSARSTKWFFSSMPAWQLIFSAALGQVVVNLAVLIGLGQIIDQMAPLDILCVWIYDILWLGVLDAVKIPVISLWEEHAEKARIAADPMQKAFNKQLMRAAGGVTKSMSSAGLRKSRSNIMSTTG